MKRIDHPGKIKDEILAELRRHKEEIAAEHDFDVRKLAEALRLKEKQHPERVVNLSTPAAEPGSHES